ncbi:MAG: glutathione peroxidase [Bacteroidetes bacterium]|nr:glutathione peroxidase [Bacteroidota bacterium]
MNKEFYTYHAISLQGEEISMEQYKNKVVLIVNTASKCGFTPQYEGLEKLHEKYHKEGLVILGFPCNQFANQEPGGKTEIEACVLNYGVSFQMFDKVNVNGKEAHPLFKFLKKSLPGTLGGRIKWNFTKFLLDAEGNPVKRFGPSTKPQEIEKDIKNLLQ